MQFDIITIFPEAFTSYFQTSILKRAQAKKRIKIVVHSLRDYTKDKHRTVDGSPYGGGAGMVMKVEPIWRAVCAIKKKKKTKVILLAANGKQFSEHMAEKFAKLDQILFICGHYEGVDERVMEFVDEAVSVGPYVLTGGELPAMTIVDAVTRLIPGVLGNPESLSEESFNAASDREYPHYTRPEIFSPKKGVRWTVPKVLLSGDHKKIADWREKHGG